MPVQLDFLTARALNRVRRRIIAQAELARRVGLAQGTISNFLRGKPIRIDHAESILGMISTVADSASLPQAQAVSVHEIISRARGLLSGDLMNNRRVGEVRGNSWEPSDYFTVIMALTDEPRLNLTKSFDYLNAEHFSSHVRCVANGVKYRWVVYETGNLLDM